MRATASVPDKVALANRWYLRTERLTSVLVLVAAPGLDRDMIPPMRQLFLSWSFLMETSPRPDQVGLVSDSVVVIVLRPSQVVTLYLTWQLLEEISVQVHRTPLALDQGYGYGTRGTSPVRCLTISGGNISATGSNGDGIGSGYGSGTGGTSTVLNLTISAGCISASASSGAAIGSGFASGGSSSISQLLIVNGSFYL
jgi:hypothetical protein